ncbi:MAG: transposase [Candidatus Yonathbacteria bacterium]|nr:transposase [Candidatus Yonathbacteria bacterium]
MIKEPLITGEYYHIYNRGVDKRDIFSDLEDLERFKESIKQFNQVEGIGSLEMYHKSTPKEVRALSSHGKSEPLVAIVAFCINPNHFHFVLKQLVDGGIAKFMQKILGGYTYYFNKKNQRAGSLLQGTYKYKTITDDNYFRKIFGYVNQNYLVHDIPKNKLHFIFSSDAEYENGLFDFVSNAEGQEMLKIFKGKSNFKKHCREIISIIRAERGKTSLDEPDELP